MSRRARTSDAYVPRRSATRRLRQAQPDDDQGTRPGQPDPDDWRARLAQPDLRWRHRAGRTASDGRPQRGRVRIWLIPAIGAAALLLAVPFVGDSEPKVDVPAAVHTPPAPAETASVLESLVPVASAYTTLEPVRGLPVTRSPTRTASTSPTASPTRSASPSPQPVLLGPSGSGELAEMVEHYCNRHYGSSSDADARRDGQWECDRFLSSSRLVDMHRACRERYGDGAYAVNSGDGAYGWRCYRNQ